MAVMTAAIICVVLPRALPGKTSCRSVRPCCSGVSRAKFAVASGFATEMTAIVKEPDVVRQLAVVGVEPTGGGPDVFDRALKDEIERVSKVVQSAGIRFE